MAFEMTPEMKGVQCFYGSTHGYSINKGLAVPDEEYKPVPIPINCPTFTEKVKFGAEMKQKHFYLESEWAYLNHGAFGAALKEGVEAQMEWLKYRERHSVRFNDREFFSHLTHAYRRVAKFIGCERDEVVFVPNATVGVNTVVQSVLRTLKKGDSILATDLAYGTVMKLLQRINRESEIRVDVIEIKFPVQSQESIVKLVEDAIKPDTKFAVLDHITSVHALCLPIKEMVDVCHKRNVLVLVDGAHCFGPVDLNMRGLGVDYYVANGHKWFLTPKGCAFLYVAKNRQSIIRPLALSWGDTFGMSAEFGWIGTCDCTAYLSILTVLDFWEFYGADNIRTYLCDTARAAGELLVKEWGTGLLADPSFYRSMVTVRLPEGLIPPDGPEVKEGEGYNFSHGACIGNILHHDYKVEVPLKAIDGKLYVRVAVHIYNEMKDIERLAAAINDIKKKNLK